MRTDAVEKVAKILKTNRLYGEGWPVQRIAAAQEVSVRTVYRWVQWARINGRGVDLLQRSANMWLKKKGV